MPVSSRAVVDLILLGPTHDRRQLQDSPILGDVWAEFATRPSSAVDLLISPYKTQPAGPVAVELSARLRQWQSPRTRDDRPDVAYLQGIIAARMYFPELLRVVVPITNWWYELRKRETERNTYVPAGVVAVIRDLERWAKEENRDRRAEIARAFGDYSALHRYAGLAALILLGNQASGATDDGIGGLLAGTVDAARAVNLFQNHLDFARSEKRERMIWQVSLNREALPAVERSVPAVKGDAARELFKVKCNDIAWAILDSGINQQHPAFMGTDADGLPCNRVVGSFDFSNIREIVSLDNSQLDPALPEDRRRVAGLLRVPEAEVARIDEGFAALRELAADAGNDRPINWGLVSKFVDISGKNIPPSTGHGTHVAGIIGAQGAKLLPPKPDGMCPDIRLYDMRVLGRTTKDTEFAVIAALQYVRYLNERNSFISVHGVNLSLSIPHDVRNFACGRTPICNECERLIESGVVVVAAAGNLGYHSFETKDGIYDGYMAFSITDPGNSDSVITVGSTHRFWPHTYGVSFFSSRGPTGDGRLKPDLVAPGERIHSTWLGQEWGDLDGTSMAAPHVSGAAAMLMGRYSELIGQPRRIKRLLCETATDLGRERSFQGHGMLDVLRAFQKM